MFYEDHIKLILGEVFELFHGCISWLSIAILDMVFGGKLVLGFSAVEY